MATASTLALGQASYELLESLGVKASTEGITTMLQATQRGRSFDLSNSGLGIESQILRVSDQSSGLIYNDTDSAEENRNSPSNANVTLLANADSSTFGLGAGDNLFNAARDLTNSEIQALDGSDTVRIGGNADGSFVALGDGADQLTVSRTSTNLDVSMGGGDDTALFLGTLSAGDGSVSKLAINGGANIVDMGDGNDRLTLLGGVQGGTPGVNGYEIQLGAGDDTVVFGGNSVSNGFLLDTGVGSDKVTLGRTTTNAAIDLGWDGFDDNGIKVDAGDLVVLGVGATLSDSAIRSGQSKDTLRLAGTVTDTSLDLGWGSSLVEVDGIAEFGAAGSTTVWDLGGGNDTLTFGELSVLMGNSGYINLGSGADVLNLHGVGIADIEFDLGNDKDSDTIVFGLNSAYSGITISNFGTNDILFIGAGSYGYGYQFLNQWANETDLWNFQQAANVIWKQAEDGGSTDQSLMTLDETFFTHEDADDGFMKTIAKEDSFHIVAIEDSVKDLADPAAWRAGSEPMSEAPPAPPSFPGDIPVA